MALQHLKLKPRVHAFFAGKKWMFIEHLLHRSFYMRQAKWLLDWFSCQFYVVDFFFLGEKQGCDIREWSRVNPAVSLQCLPNVGQVALRLIQTSLFSLVPAGSVCKAPHCNGEDSGHTSDEWSSFIHLRTCQKSAYYFMTEQVSPFKLLSPGVS